VAGIRAVANGHVYLQPALALWLIEDYRRLLKESAGTQSSASTAAESTLGLEVLSKREVQVLEAVADGLTSSQIGERLGISPKTVARHRERIMDKLNLHSGTELVKYAFRSGLIELK
jgi:two-component system response regulator NreC